jgi:hypothetical protein
LKQFGGLLEDLLKRYADVAKSSVEFIEALREENGKLKQELSKVRKELDEANNRLSDYAWEIYPQQGAY